MAGLLFIVALLSLLSHGVLAITHYVPKTWTLSTDTFLPNQYQNAPYVANGYFGQRLPAEGTGYWIYKKPNGDNVLDSWPLDQPRATFGTISGFWNLLPNLTHAILPGNLKHGGESVISGIPDWSGLTVTTAHGVTYQPGTDEKVVKGYHQSMSIKDGVVKTNILWEPEQDKGIWELNYTVVAHRTRLNLGIVRLDIKVDTDVEFKITDILDGAGAVRSDLHQKEHEQNVMWTSVKPRGINYVTAYVVSAVTFGGSMSELDMASANKHDGGDYDWVSKNESTIAQTWDWSLKKGQSLTVYKYVGLASSTAFLDDTFSVAREAALQAVSTPWDQLLAEHTAEWEETWADADILVPGNEELQIRSRASLFHLLSSTPPPSGTSDEDSIMVGGLTSDSYGGLIFWDAETWMYPSLLSLHPEYSKTINNYRGKLLDQAIKNAQHYSFSGALYPWTSGKFGNCTGTGVCKDYQYHLNSDIALAHWQYFQQTKDLDWLAEKGWKVIKAVADMFASYVKPKGDTGLYETIHIAEPDEFAYSINNGAYSNSAIKMLLGDWAPTAARLLGHDIPANWSRIANNMYIPFNEEEQIVIEFDGMDGAWQVKQASVGLIHYPLGLQLSEAQAKNDVSYYSSVNTADGPAMTWSIYAISEAKLERKGCAAYTYLERASADYIRHPFYQFSEVMRDSAPEGVDNPAFIFGLQPAFPFLTGAGGFLQVLTHGLTGMRSNLDAFTIDPVLPPQMKHGITIKGMKWQGAVFDVEIESDYTTITRRVNRRNTSKADETVPVVIDRGREGDTKTHHLSEGQSITVTTRQPGISDAPGDIALCRPVVSGQDSAPGQFPLAVVDGSNSTVWQPLHASEASVTIDLESDLKLSSVHINWGRVPPQRFTISGSLTSTTGFSTLASDDHVHISAPYDPEQARLVRIRVGNTTDISLPEQPRVRYLRLTIEGSHVPDGLGATVAEVVATSAKKPRGYLEVYSSTKQSVMGIMNRLARPLNTATGQKAMQYFTPRTGSRVIKGGAMIKTWTSINWFYSRSSSRILASWARDIRQTHGLVDRENICVSLCFAYDTYSID